MSAEVWTKFSPVALLQFISVQVARLSEPLHIIAVAFKVPFQLR
jgi:hypothetical protein